MRLQSLRIIRPCVPFFLLGLIGCGSLGLTRSAEVDSGAEHEDLEAATTRGALGFANDQNEGAVKKSGPEVNDHLAADHLAADNLAADSGEDGDGEDGDGDGFSVDDGDCDDTDSSVYPGATEVCDGLDNDCDGIADDGLDDTYFYDGDGDGYGDASVSLLACDQPEGYVKDGADCDDRMWSVNPAGIEICNGFDDDCDGLTDSEDEFDVTSGDIASFDADCDSFEWLSLIEVPVIQVIFNIRGMSDNNTNYGGLFIGGHTSNTSKPVRWPKDCLFMDEGYFWYNLDEEDYTYRAQICFSEGTDAEGGDELYMQMTYYSVVIRGVFNTESDSDSERYDKIYLSEQESDEKQQVWYISESASTRGLGYEVTVKVEGARGRNLLVRE